MLTILIGICVAMGRQQQESPWIAELRLNDCELPCWIGIVPGQTTLADARQRIEETYGYAAHNYLVERLPGPPTIFLLQATNQLTGYGLLVGVITNSSSSTPEQAPIQIISIFPFIEDRANLRPLVLPDLYSLLSEVEGIATRDGYVSEAILFYEDYQVGVRIDPRPCHKVPPAQEIMQIFLSDPTSTQDRGWAWEGLLQWQGFGRCYGT